jgi:crossover junction endodeoxyribonuclease RuvC
MKILGIDPGLNITGYGLVETVAEGQKLIEAGEIKSKASLPLEQRLLELHNGLEDVIKELRPDVLVVEELYSHYKHPRTAVIMGHARGVLFLVAGKSNIPVFSYSATRIKKSLTGMGRAGKEQVAKMIASTLKCEEMYGHPDITDALAAALCHINAISHGNIL